MIIPKKIKSVSAVIPFGMTLLSASIFSATSPGAEFAGKSRSADAPTEQKPHIALASGYEACLDSADRFIRSERWEEAAAATRTALQIRPASPLNTHLFSNLGICLMHTGDYDGAAEAFSLSLVRDSLNASVLASRASAYMLLDMREDALRDASKALCADSTLPAALRIHGQLALLAHDMPSARRDFNKLCETDSTEVWGPAGLARCLILEENYNDAIPLLRKAISLSDDESLRISLIESLIQTNKLGDAEEAIRDAISHFPSAGHLYLLRGVIHKKFYQNSEAEIDKKIAREYGVDSQTIERYLPSTPK